MYKVDLMCLNQAGRLEIQCLTHDVASGNEIMP